MRVLSTVRFTALRMARNYIVLLLLLVVPMLIITLFSFILSGMVTESGVPYLYENAMTMVFCFQLFGGSIVMYLIHHDLLSANRARMYALPFNPILYAFSIMMCGVIFSVFLGLMLMLYTQYVLGVEWGHWLWIVYNLSLLAVLSIIVALIITFTVKPHKLAERLVDVYGVGVILLAGLFFPMPDHAVFDFMGSYGNPLVIALMSVGEMQKSNPGEAWLLSSLLLAAIGILFIVMLAAGRRKLA